MNKVLLKRENKIFIVRLLETDKSTLGIFHIRGREFYTLEPPWVNNKVGVSRIPEGIYKCQYRGEREYSKFDKAWLVENVEGRTQILLHRGNSYKDTAGCIVFGTGYFYDSEGEPHVTNSAIAMSHLEKLHYEMEYQLHITEQYMESTSINKAFHDRIVV